jgi:hypothetical protein
MTRPPKPFSTPSWVVGRDFPDPNERAQGTVPSTPPGDSRRGGPLAPPVVRPLSESSVPPPISTPQNLRPPSESSVQPPISSPQNVRPHSEPNVPPPTPNPLKTRPAAPKSNPQPPTSNYHSGKCSICNHPDRVEIEAAFLNWEPADRLVADFNLPARSSIYRHAKAAGLLNQRRNNFRSALDQIIEQGGRIPPTASNIISAVELSYRLSGADVAPLKRYETTHIYINKSNSAPSAPSAVRPSAESTPQQQSGHPNIVAPPNSLNPKEGPHKQSGHTRGT